MAEWKRAVYQQSDYTNKLLLLEKTTIMRSMTINRGMIKKCHSQLCPQDQPYKYNHFLRVLKKHGIKKEDYR